MSDGRSSGSPRDALASTGSYDYAALAPEYVVDGDAIRPEWSGGRRPSYLPAGFPLLAIDLVNLVAGPGPISLEMFLPRAEEFTTTWGVIDAPLGERKPATEGSVQDLWITARLASVVMDVIQTGVSEVVEDHFVEAQQMINDVMFREASFVLGGTITGRKRTFQWTYRFRTLRAVAFWHLGNYAIGEHRVGRCLECGKRFERTDGRQKFCPPLYYDGYGRRQSPCSLRRRQRKHRTGKE